MNRRMVIPEVENKVQTFFSRDRSVRHLRDSVQSLSHVRLFATPWITACQASLSVTNSRSLSKPMSLESVMPSSHLILCRLLLLPPISPSIRVFSNESAFLMRWQKYQSFIFNISPSSEHSGLISFRMDWLDLLAVQGTLESSPTPQFKGVQFSLSASSMHSTHWNFLVYRQVI